MNTYEAYKMVQLITTIIVSGLLLFIVVASSYELYIYLYNRKLKKRQSEVSK